MRKLDIAKEKDRENKGSQITTKIEVDQSKQIEKLEQLNNNIINLWKLLNDKEEYDFDKLSKQLETLHARLDFDPIIKSLEGLTPKDTVSIKDFNQLLDAVSANKPVEADLSKLEKAIIQVEQRVQEGIVQDNKTDPEDYKPVRRVVKVGNRLVYDDQPTPSRGGGGSGGSSSGGLTDAELRASPVPVEATIDTTGLATDTGQDAQTALLTTIDADTGAIKTAVETLDNAISGSEMQVDVVAALPAGNNNIGDVDVASIAAGDNNIGNVDVVTLPALPAGNNNIGDVDVASLPGDVEADIDQIRDQIDAQNTGSSTMNASSSDGATALTNTAQVIKASAGRLTGYFIYNPNATAQFVQFYNTAAASVTVGTTNPLFMITIPATSAANLWMGEDGPNFSNAGWSWAATSTAGGNGAPGSALDAVAWYK